MQKFPMLFILFLFIAIGFVSFSFTSYFGEGEKSDFDKSKELIVMRKIAYDILLYSRDSTSQILPAKQISTNEFIIPFESQFAFLPDSLVSIIDKSMITSSLSKNYVINVIEDKSENVVFGYVMSDDEQQNIVPCKGRLQSPKQYSIQIKFQPQKAILSNVFLSNVLLFGSLLLLIGGVFAFIFRAKISHIASNTPTIEEEKPTSPTSFVAIGKYFFYPTEQRLEFGNEQVILTAKESKLLSIFSSHINQVVDRERLQKEVWEDEGVIVGRSLDMFISKLRKRLDKDENIKLINIHSKGYKLANSTN